MVVACLPQFSETATGHGVVHVPSRSMNAEQWLAGYRDRLTELQARTLRAQDALAAAEATVTSPDGAVTVTVNPAGALRALVLSERTATMTRTALAAAVLATAQTAQGRAASAAMAAVAPLLGQDSEAMSVLRSHFPRAER
jgi:DNA-binding protein YbaB